MQGVLIGLAQRLLDTVRLCVGHRSASQLLFLYHAFTVCSKRLAPQSALHIEHIPYAQNVCETLILEAVCPSDAISGLIYTCA